MPLLNATTFGTTYLARGKQPLGMWIYAEISFMEAIEVPYTTPDQLRRAAVYLPPAATWILLAGEKIHELCKSDLNREDGAPGWNMNGDDSLWGKSRGYSLGRWAWWKRGFGEIATMERLQDRLKDFAARASAEMDRIESQAE